MAFPATAALEAAAAFSAPPNEPLRQVAQNYLARRLGVAASFPPPERDALFQVVALGLETHSFFSTLVILK